MRAEFYRPDHPEDVVGVVRRVYDGRVRFHDGDTELHPGISLHLIGGHTMGLQVVRVATRDVPIPFSPPLEAAVLPSVDRVKEACRELLEY